MKRNKLTTVALVLIFFVGLSLLLYPSVSDYWNSLHQSRAIASYVEQVTNLDDDKYDSMLEAARQYNRSLLTKKNPYIVTDEEKAQYNSLLNLAGNGIMGYISIPSLACTLPIYHGTEEAVLQVAIGHIEWSSLPVGGTGTHTVVSGHRGLPSAKLFTNLDKLKEGDLFTLQVLDETLTYEVDQILIVLPQEIESLKIDPEEDYCTLVTCTPYGVNSHRLLVRGHRIETVEAAKVFRVTADAIQIEPIVMAPLVAAPMLLILFIWLVFAPPKKPDDSFRLEE